MKHVKRILVCLFLIGWCSSNAQTASSIAEIENKIAQYIDLNKNSITLDPQVSHNHKEVELDLAQQRAYETKRISNKLRARFFKENPSYRKLYENKPLRSQSGCINPGFENGANDYSFYLHDDGLPNGAFNGCSTIVNTAIPLTAANNDPFADVSLVTTGLDPTLLALNINLSTTYNGSQAIRLNAPLPGTDIVTMTKNVNITDDTFVFNFAIVLENPDHPPSYQPFFQVRIYDALNEIVYERCILSDPEDCIFTSADPTSDLLYTDWSCFPIDTTNLIGQNVRVEWSIADCGAPGHFGYIYIDDVCEEVCSSPIFGNVELNEIDGHCADFPLEVCGTFSPPLEGTNQEGTVDQIRLYLSNGGLPILLPLSPTLLTNSTFCFEIPLGLVDSTSDYEISVEMDFAMNCNPTPYIYTLSDESTNDGPDISFEEIDVDLGQDLQGCQGTPLTFGIPPIPGVEYQWCVNTFPLPEETDSTITVITGGIYTLKVTIGGCEGSDDILVLFKSTPNPAVPDDIVLCDENPADGFAEFDLTQRINQIKNGDSNAAISFHSTQADAIADVNQLGYSYTNTNMWGETIYARSEYLQTGCFEVVPLNLVVEFCCEFVSCADLDVNKSITAPLTSTINAGEIITYEICVFNNEIEYACEEDFTILDKFDITRLDLSTFNITNITPTIQDITITDAGPSAKHFNIVGLPGQEEVCITFEIQVRCDAPEGKLTNCGIVNKSLSCQDISCTSISVTQLPSEWPRTYGGSANAKRYALDSAVGDCGSIYTIGILTPGDTSNEDSTFTSTGQGYIMKHDYSGNLLWIEYINNVYEESRIEFAGNRIVILQKEFPLEHITIASYDVNGIFLNNYNIGPANFGADEILLTLNQSSGDIFVAGVYRDSYSTPDFSINATEEDHVAAIFKFRNHPTGILYIDHELIIDDPADPDPNADIEFYDMTYAEDINKLYVGGVAVKGDIIFPDGTVHELSDGNKSFLISFDTGTSSVPLTFDHLRFFNSTTARHMDFNNILDKLYVLDGSRMYTLHAQTLNVETSIGSLPGSTGNVKEFDINQENGNIYGVSNIPSPLPNDISSNGVVWKFTNNSGPTWLKYVDQIESWDIVAGYGGHAYICGNYYDDTAFETLNPSQQIFHYGSILPDIFIARIKDNGANGVFKSPISNAQLRYSIYPNPTSGLVNIDSREKQTTNVSEVIITDYYGRVLFRKSNFNLAETINLGSNLSDGLYFVRISSNEDEIEIHNLIIGGK